MLQDKIIGFLSADLTSFKNAVAESNDYLKGLDLVDDQGVIQTPSGKLNQTILKNVLNNPSTNQEILAEIATNLGFDPNQPIESVVAPEGVDTGTFTDPDSGETRVIVVGTYAGGTRTGRHRFRSGSVTIIVGGDTLTEQAYYGGLFPGHTQVAFIPTSVKPLPENPKFKSTERYFGGNIDFYASPELQASLDYRNDNQLKIDAFRAHLRNGIYKLDEKLLASKNATEKQQAFDERERRIEEKVAEKFASGSQFEPTTPPKFVRPTS